ncbi:hypothetical protein [Rhodovulum sulfidophilum]|uniref:TraR/DksA family transcriptional regulator n=1 Tax=Rhodovulum sulfidophilum TaxID=35806 RepID=UPI003075B846
MPVFRHDVTCLWPGILRSKHGEPWRGGATASAGFRGGGPGWGGWLHDIGTELRPAPIQGRVELAVEREEDEVLQGLDRWGRAGFRPVRAALARIESGGYGFCVRCGEGVAEGRLDAGFATPFCRICAR